MKRGRLPLTALRSFEMAGRLESFTAAAEALNVSQAAISRQVRELEAIIGTALFVREHRRVRLSEAGRSLLLDVTAGFDRIDRALETIRAAGRRGSVSLSVEPGFAALVLVPALGAFEEAHPGIDVVLEADARLADFRGGGPDLAIRFSASRENWPGLEARRLIAETVTVVLAPDLLPEKPASGDWLASLPLIHDTARAGWREMLARLGHVTEEPARGPVLADSGLVAQAALRGQGAALGNPVFLAEDLASGRLVAPFPETLFCGHYFLVCRAFDELSPAARLFADWLALWLGDALPRRAAKAIDTGNKPEADRA